MNLNSAKSVVGVGMVRYTLFLLDLGSVARTDRLHNAVRHHYRPIGKGRSQRKSLRQKCCHGSIGGNPDRFGWPLQGTQPHAWRLRGVRLGCGFSTNAAKVTITRAQQTMNLTLGGVLSLGDLGFSPAQTQGSAQDQARLDKRSHMLKIHQRIGLIDTAPWSRRSSGASPAARAPVRGIAGCILLSAR